MKSSDELRPGERAFGILLVMFSALVFWESYRISGFSGLSTGGAMPMFASGVMFISAIVILGGTLRRSKAQHSGLSGLVAYLFPLRIVVFVVLLVAYVVVIPIIGFLVASTALLLISIWWLWDRGFVWALVLSLIFGAAIHVLFRVVFQVVLPAGSVWQ